MSGIFTLHYLSCHILLCFAFCLWNHIFSILIFSLVVLRKILQVLRGDDRESTSLLFCLGNSESLSLRTCLILPHMLGQDIVSFPYSMSLLFFCLIF
jgi:hypothetical protein